MTSGYVLCASYLSAAPSAAQVFPQSEDKYVCQQINGNCIVDLALKVTVWCWERSVSLNLLSLSNEVLGI